MEQPLWLQLLVSLAGVALLWGVYALLIRFFPVYFQGCFRAGRRLPGRSFLYGAALFSSLLALTAFLLFSLRIGSGALIGWIFMLFQLAGLGAGLVSLGGFLGVIDPEKSPYGALGLGLALFWMARMFSVPVSNAVSLLIGIYGVGAMIVHYRGDALEKPVPAPVSAPARVSPPAAGQPAPAAPGPAAVPSPEQKTPDPAK